MLKKPKQKRNTFNYNDLERKHAFHLAFIDQMKLTPEGKAQWFAANVKSEGMTKNHRYEFAKWFYWYRKQAS